jgi:tRNA pseudouridine55 synthase
MSSSPEGIILIDKNEGESSFDVVRKAKRAFKIKKVGHAGTLDPFATGLLIILLGQGTKLSSYLMSGKKRYLATMTLGIETDTLDKTGRITNMMPVPEIDPETIRKVMQGFTGKVEQTPPLYSALNYHGQRAYKLARQGISVELEKRTVTIHAMDIISIDLPCITFEVTCSGGTYIRSLAADIGERLGSTAHLNALRRLSSGPFEVIDAIDSKILGECHEDNDLAGETISLKDALPDIKECVVDRETAKRIMNGRRPGWDEVGSWDPSLNEYHGLLKITDGSSMIAVMVVDRRSRDEKAWLKNIRVFN